MTVRRAADPPPIKGGWKTSNNAFENSTENEGSPSCVLSKAIFQETHYPTDSLNQVKSCFFEKTIKTDKLPARKGENKNKEMKKASVVGATESPS